MMAQNEFVVVGIDVAKDKVDACIRSLSQRQTFPSGAEGRRKLIAWLRDHGRQGGDGGERRLRADWAKALARQASKADRRPQTRDQLRIAGASPRTMDRFGNIAWFAETNHATIQTCDAARTSWCYSKRFNARAADEPAKQGRACPPEVVLNIGATAEEDRLEVAKLEAAIAAFFRPLPSCGARRVQYDKLTENDTVAAAAHDFPAAFEIILQVLPGTKTIAIVNGASPNEAFWQGVLQRELEPLSKRVKIKWYNELSFEEMLKDAANLPPNSAIFWHLLSVDAAGVAHEANAALHRFSATANAPIFSYLDVWFGEAILGGSMQSAQEGSAVAAAAAIRILDGEKAGDVKIPPTHFTPPRFDWRQMQRFGISDSDLPRGSEIYFREPTVWQRYPEQIALTIVVILAQAALISILLHEYRRRRLAEVQSRQRMAELAHINRYSTAGELTASISHEINQPLGSILTNAETAREILTSPAPDIVELNSIVDDIIQDDRRASEVIRRMRSLLKKAPFEQKEIDLNVVVRVALRRTLVELCPAICP